MVRLKVGCHDRSVAEWDDFNSYMVRLKVLHLMTDKYDTKFQFLYGAIKSKLPLIPLIFSTRFQFLYGAIKSFVEVWKGINTTSFQFLYGAIKREERESGAKKVYLFQFLYGAIKRSIFAVVCESIYYFNSYMVRLKVRVSEPLLFSF